MTDETTTPEAEAVSDETQPQQEGAEAAKEKQTGASAKPDTGDDAPAEQPEGGDGEEAGEQPGEAKPQKPKGGFQRRIGELTANWRDAQRERDYWREVAMGRVQPPQPTTQAQQPQAKAPPRQEDFQRYEDYVAALAEHKAEQAFERRMAEQQQSQQATTAQSQRAQLSRSYAERCNALAEQDGYEDFHDVIASSDVMLANGAAEALMESDSGPRIAYHLAMNPAEAQKIARMSPIGQIREIGKLEARLSTPPRPPKSPGAPPPIRPLAGSGSATRKDPSKMSMEEYAAWRKAGNG